ncbi:MAG: geranylgeranylglyceryl/heptaprenylglyceryl phosphate synthase [Saprospiraceae bacterium]|nr:geranylgeranylglyceryl/heptaprenylglyceryl phosphate synthase [Saprospiraceae bacterium]
MPKIAVYQAILNAKEQGKKQLAVLIDPDKAEPAHLERLLDLALQSKVDFFFVGGSLVMRDTLDDCLGFLKSNSDIPCIIFPGSVQQISSKADAILLLSLISGRNPELLIGQHVIAAPYLRESGLEVISTGYMLVDGGTPTTVSYISSTTPIPANKNDIAVCTAIAGEMLGLKISYLDAGSGAENPVAEQMIAAVSRNVGTPIVVGGGIRTPEKAYANAQAGADIQVVGNLLEKNPSLMLEMADAVHSMNKLQEKGIL